MVNSIPPNLEFVNLNSTVSLHLPDGSPFKTSSTDPTTIIICSWMGASPRSRALHAAFQKHHQLFPNSRILHIRNLPEVFTRTSTATRHADILPALSALASDPSPTPRILVHIFSNGGSFSFLDICTLYLRKHNHVLPIEKIIFDSAPGQPTSKESWGAITLILPRSPVFWYPLAFLLLVLLVVQGVARVFGFRPLIYKNYEALNDWKLVAKAERLYVYSDGDKLVGAGDVERHADGARKQGVVVNELREKETAHVQHMIWDQERYWKTIEEFWRGE